MVAQEDKSSAEPSEVISIIRRVFSENGRDFVPQYVMAALCMLVAAPTAAFNAWIMKVIVDDVFVGRQWDWIGWIAASIVVVFGIRGLANYGQAVLLAEVGNGIVARYQSRIFRHLMRLGMNYFATTRSGQLAAQVNQNITGIRDLLNMTLAAFVRDGVTLVTLLVTMLFMDPMLFLFVIMVGPPLAFAINYIMRRVRRLTRETVEINSHLLGAMQESVQGVTVVKAFTMEEVLAQKMGGLIQHAEERSNKIARVSERMAPVTELLAGIAIAAVIVYAGWRASASAEPPGSVFGFITALFLAYDPARKLARLQVGIERALVNARMIYELLDIEPHQRDMPGAKPLQVSKGDIRFENVRFSYNPHTPVLHGLSFEAKAGRKTAIVGASGAGKSTLFSLLQRFYDLDSGSITIDGQDIAKVTKRSLRSSIAFVSQHPYLFEGTIRDNIRYGRPDATDEEIEAAGRMANAEEFILDQPNGYDTPIGENGVTLSGGQRQRISIARAIVRDAPILLLDEATSALDNESEAKVQQALERAMKTRTTIVIAHRLSTVIDADQIVVMEAGRLVEKGTHRTLVSRPHGIYARFYRMQTDRAEDLLQEATAGGIETSEREPSEE